MRERKDGVETRRRILEAAAVEFRDNGYRDVRIAQICKRAGTNVASVNYHFGGKETLYVEAWRQALQRSIETYPPDGGVMPDAPAVERLGGRIRSLLSRILDPENAEFEIIHREMANPTGLLAEAMAGAIEPIRQGMCEVIAELLGDCADEESIRLCGMSIVSQCFFNKRMQQRKRMIHGSAPVCGDDTVPVPDIGIITAHITAFSLGGIQAIRCRLEGERAS